MTYFLTEQQVLEIHEAVIEQFGGLTGIRDIELLRSAIEQPQAKMFGDFLHPSIFDKAAAYLFHLCKNHAFLDGNKRTSLSCALLFLQSNGYSFHGNHHELVEFVVTVANSNSTKFDIAHFFETHCRKIS